MISSKPFIDIPTWENGRYTTTGFSTRESFRDFLIPLFKEPGLYDFDETAFLFNEQAHIFNGRGFYTTAAEGTRDYKTYWDTEKAKCRYGHLFKSGDKTWYLSREYYMWVNFLKINNKELKKFTFPDVRDVQYHIALYELLAELHFKHASVLKKRQIASSYYHMAKIINILWFEETPVIKMGASLKDYINEKGVWRFLVEYKDFLDTHTAWYRPMNPGQVLHWQQQIEVTDSVTKRGSLIGLKGVLQGMSFEQSETNGVGGPCSFFYYEEAGIAPTMDITTEFLFPAMSDGAVTTGLFVAAGSVGNLEACEPLRKMTIFPDRNDIYPVTSNLLDEKGTVGESGLFVPEQWSMNPFIDRFGNSLVKEAMEAIALMRIQWKKDLTPEKYQFRISQHPTNIAEAFASRKESPFPLHLVKANMRRIEDNTYKTEYLDITRNAEGLPTVSTSTKSPISTFPIDEKKENKEGCLVVWERPGPNPEWKDFYASIDPVGEGKTTSSDSLCSIHVYKRSTQITRIDGDKAETFIEQGKIVAAWCGRHDDLRDTHKKLELIIEWYNAWTLVENNISQFIIYMIERHKQKYLATKDQIVFLKELRSNTNVYQDYGWKNTGTLFRSHLLSYLIDYLKEELDHETKPDGTIVRTTYGIERIPDMMAMLEMLAYTDKLNVDRLVSLSALIAFAKIQEASIGIKRKVEQSDKINLEKSKNLYKLDKGFFRHIGTTILTGVSQRPPRQAFRNIK